VSRIRTDGKIDLTLTPIGRAAVDAARETILAALERAGGRLALGDESSPEEIRRVLGLSKKAFKRAAGGLYRERRIRIDDHSVESRDRKPGKETSGATD
jgi:predicted RNA-binding protein (virulence factor B family)